MYSTKYVKPNSTTEALEAIKSLGEGKFLAGGMTLIPTLKPVSYTHLTLPTT